MGNILNKLEKEIIKFVTENQPCTLDQIFKGLRVYQYEQIFTIVHDIHDKGKLRKQEYRSQFFYLLPEFDLDRDGKLIKIVCPICGRLVGTCPHDQKIHFVRREKRGEKDDT